MQKKIAGLDIREFAALLVRLSIQNTSCSKVAAELDKSLSLIHKWMENDEAQVPNLKQWLELVTFTRDFEGVKRLAEACGFVVVRRNGSVPQVLRDLAEDLERQEAAEGQPRPPIQYRFPGEREA